MPSAVWCLLSLLFDPLPTLRAVACSDGEGGGSGPGFLFVVEPIFHARGGNEVSGHLFGIVVVTYLSDTPLHGPPITFLLFSQVFVVIGITLDGTFPSCLRTEFQARNQRVFSKMRMKKNKRISLMTYDVEWVNTHDVVGFWSLCTNLDNESDRYHYLINKIRKKAYPM